MKTDHRAAAERLLEARNTTRAWPHIALAALDLLEQRLPEPDAPSESETDPHAPCGCDREGENTPPASQNGPQGARSADSGTGGPPEPENGAQGRIGWLRLYPGAEDRLLMREAPGGWTNLDESDGPLMWHAEVWPRAEFTPIRTLADDEVAVKRDDLQWAVDVGRLSGPGGTMKRLRAVLEADR